MLAADQPFVQLAEQPEGLFAHLGKRRRRKGDWTADQDRQLILQFWRHLIDPAKWPAKDITVDEGLRHGEAVKMRLKTLRRDRTSRPSCRRRRRRSWRPTATSAT